MRADNRAALLRGARACLDKRGYARTRARDVATAAGVSTAAIGYHFGTTDALLIAALMDGMEEWSRQLDRRLRSLAAQPFSGRLAEIYRCVADSLPGHRGVLAASFELIARADDDVYVQRQLRRAVAQARRGLAEQMLGIDADADPDRADRAGAACYAMVSGLIVQWLVDPDALPRPEPAVADLRQAFGEAITDA